MKLTMVTAALLAASAATAASAANVVEVEPNDTLATAQNIDAFFSLDSNPDIANSTTVPHATVIGLPGNGTFDFFSFTVAAPGATGTFDIDDAMPFFDSLVILFDSAGNSLAGNDDADISLGGGGSVHPFDSFLTYQFVNAGTYAIRVGNFPNGTPQNGGNGYRLHVSIQDHQLAAAVPEPATWAMMIGGFGMVGGAMRSSRRRNRRDAAVFA